MYLKSPRRRREKNLLRLYRRRPQTEKRKTDKDNGAPRGPRFARPPRRRVFERKLLKDNGAPRGPRFARPPRRRLFERKRLKDKERKEAACSAEQIKQKQREATAGNKHGAESEATRDQQEAKATGGKGRQRAATATELATGQPGTSRRQKQREAAGGNCDGADRRATRTNSLT